MCRPNSRPYLDQLPAGETATFSFRHPSVGQITSRFVLKWKVDVVPSASMEEGDHLFAAKLSDENDLVLLVNAVNLADILGQWPQVQPRKAVRSGSPKLNVSSFSWTLCPAVNVRPSAKAKVAKALMSAEMSSQPTGRITPKPNRPSSTLRCDTLSREGISIMVTTTTIAPTTANIFANRTIRQYYCRPYYGRSYYRPYYRRGRYDYYYW